MMKKTPSISFSWSEERKTVFMSKEDHFTLSW